MKKIIMLSGKGGAGKDTFASMLGEAWERVAFADAVREKACELTSYPMSWFIDRDKKDSPINDTDSTTPRDILIQIGMDARERDPDFWIKEVIKKIESSDSEYFVITDWRFPNEFFTIKDHFETDCEASQIVSKIRVVGSNSLRSSHESECALDQFGFEHIVYNTGSLETLDEKAKTLASIYGEEAAVEWVYSFIYSRMKNQIRARLYNKSYLDDIVQDGILKMQELIREKYNFRCSLGTFVYSSANYDSRNRKRKIECYDRHVQPYGGPSDMLGSFGKEDTGDFLLADLLERALSKLDDEKRELFELWYNDVPHKEIAEKLGIKENCSRRRLFLIKKQLQKELSEVYLQFV